MELLKKLTPYLGEHIISVLNLMDASALYALCEIRIRSDAPLALTVRGSTYFVDYNGDLYRLPSPHCVSVSGKELGEILLKMCRYSMHLYTNSMKNGYITLDGGYRVGVALRGVYEDGSLISVNSVTSLNIRIPRAIKGCADRLLNTLYQSDIPSVIIAGAAGSGKTTLLRDMAQGLTDGRCGKVLRCVVLDEREELTCDGTVLQNCDILRGFTKAQGIENALRSLSPQVVICDELATVEETEQIRFGFASGIKFIVSLHLGRQEDLTHKTVLHRLWETGEFSYLILLHKTDFGYDIFDLREAPYEVGWSPSTDIIDRVGRNHSSRED